MRTRLNEPTAAKIDVISFSIWEINKCRLRNGALTKIHSTLLFPSLIPTCIARRKVHVSRFWRRDSMWLQRESPGSLKETRGVRIAKITILHNGRNIGWYEIWAAQANARYRGPALYLHRAMPKYADTRNPDAETAAYKSTGCSVRETPGASPEAREAAGVYVSW